MKPFRSTLLPEFWYLAIGNDAHGKLQQKEGEVRILTGRSIEGRRKNTGILRITKHRSRPKRFLLKATLFHESGEDNIERLASAEQLRLMFDLKRDFDEGNDMSFAAQFGADFAVPGLFVRAGDKIAFPNPGNGLPRDPHFCFQRKPQMARAIEDLINAVKTQ